MKIFIDKKLRFFYVLTITILVITYFLFFSLTNRMIEHNRLASYSKNKIANLEILLFNLKHAGKNYQDYILNGNSDFLKKVKEEKIKIDSSLKLITVSLNDSLQNRDSEKLQALVNKVTLNYNMGLPALVFKKNILSDTLQKISNNASLATSLAQLHIKVMQNGCKALFIKDDASANNCLNSLRITYFTSLIIAVLIAFVSIFNYLRESSARIKADAQAQLFKAQLEQRVDELNSNKEIKELKDLEKFAATGRIARMIAHEVRNPLTNIGLANDQLKDAIDANEENLMLINMIKRNGERINQLVGDLLNATKFVELNLSEYVINDLLDDVILMAKNKEELKI